MSWYAAIAEAAVAIWEMFGDDITDWLAGGCSDANKRKYRDKAKAATDEELLAWAKAGGIPGSTGDCRRSGLRSVAGEVKRRFERGGKTLADAAREERAGMDAGQLRAKVERLQAQLRQATTRSMTLDDTLGNVQVAFSRERAELMSLFEPLGLVTRRQYNATHGYQSYQWSESVVGPVISETNDTGAHPFAVTPTVRAAVASFADKGASGGAGGGEDGNDDALGVSHIIALGLGAMLGRATGKNGGRGPQR